jgi:hypothetical protein
MFSPLQGHFQEEQLILVEINKFLKKAVSQRLVTHYLKKPFWHHCIFSPVGISHQLNTPTVNKHAKTTRNHNTNT